MEKYTVEDKGTITLGSKVMVSDPCYGLNTWCQGVLENVLPGRYSCKVGLSDEGDWGIRVADIEARHVNYADGLEYQAEDFEVGVDSGTAGIFDYEYYCQYHTDSSEWPHANRSWLDRCYNVTEEYIKNPHYVSFLDLAEYKAALMCFRHDLNVLKAKYPELDVDSVYEEKINHYHKLMNDNYDCSLDGLRDILRRLKEIEDGTYEPPKRTDAENELVDVECKYGDMLHNLWVVYNKKIVSQKNLYRNSGGTTDGLGLMSSSGYGDGGYECFTARNDEGKIVSIRVEFIGEDEDDEDC